MPRKSARISTARDPQNGQAIARLERMTEGRAAIIETTCRLVEHESPSDNKPAVDHLGEYLAGEFEGLGARVIVHRQHEFGNHIQADFAGRSSRQPLLLLGHYDTVWPLGTLAKMPCRVADGRIWGPGSLDMKAGIALIMHSIAALRESGGLPRPVSVLVTTDEEVGSESSRAIIERLALQSAGVLVLEPAQGLKGAVKTARKGVGDYRLNVRGRAAHAGVDFEKGHSAIVELARQIAVIHALNGLKPGLTLNVGVVQGGTRTNVIAAEASAEIDVRIARKADAGFVDRKLRSLRQVDRECNLEITGGINRPPMERTKGVASLYQTASGLAKRLDWKLQEASTGGGSDGNFTAGLGVPTLDGLGAVGEGAHAVNESVVIAELPRRAALLAMLIEAI